VIGTPTHQCYSCNSIWKFHEIAIIYPECCERKEVVQLPRDASSFAVIDEVIPLLRIWKKRWLIMNTFGTTNEAAVM
jgi:hypothetical protein